MDRGQNQKHLKDKYEVKDDLFFTLEDVEKALNFTLISEGLLRNELLYNEAITLKVRLHSLAISTNAKLFNYPAYITMNNYIASLVTKNNRKSQIINFNLEDLDDRLAKTIVKIYSKMFFEFTKSLKVRASIPLHRNTVFLPPGSSQTIYSGPFPIWWWDRIL